jgi:hypothetical protein
MQMMRSRHWATRAFHAFLQARAYTPFAWGVHDCALFAADGIEAMTGIDIAADFRGKYSDEAGALEAIKAIAGGETVADAAAWCAAKHGIAELARPLFAQRGDLVVYRDPVTEQLVSGLVHLTGRHIVSAGTEGLRKIPISRVLRAWHV